ncbi:PepSY domain-containing protein [Dysgonomonas sp. ZJ709]|uniref:PepSY-associated TM helix domain-containing protein n=1 Tax=Dysgonomonas sp. ZJ709 TaxID=2709797 RepID=UPI0013EDF5AD|nr:PepSY-associated TM helix domain-containing protein [Dysgonomonas sp. ZJ709]
MRKFFRRFHKWLALPVGLIISITCLTGAILVFQDEILEACNPHHYFIEEVKGSPIPLNELVPIVDAQLKDNTVSDVKVSSDPNRTYTMTLAEGFRVVAFVNPYTGEVVGKYEPRESFFWTIMSLHRWLMDGSRTWGKYTVGISTILLAFILVSGAVLWMPKSKNKGKKKWKGRFTIKTRSGRKRLFYDLHNVLGMYACLILLVCALTGLMWSFEWYRLAVFTAFGVEEPSERPRTHGGEKKEKPAVNPTHWQSVFEEVKVANPDYEYIRVQDGTSLVHLKSSAVSRANDKYDFDKKTGQIKKVTLYKDQAKTTRIWGWAYSLHVGNYWGVWSKILTCLASLIGASLPLTGYYLFYVKRKKRKKKKRSKD